MYSLSKSARVSRSRLRIAVPVVLLFTAACASTPPIPSASLQAAQQSIANAERVEAGTHAPAQLGEARNKLSAAQRAVDEEKMIVAGWLADEARADAELAVATTSAAKANAVNADMKRSTATLVEEMQRKTGDSR
ncbi:MAG: hypothetical protein K0Q92_2198 [Steroidobacteraceae bacterium]|jgi:hypothetical protein|nr:hypothetical protein [Steroidobacteraceae bacterium]